MEGATEEARAPGSPAGFSLPPSLSRDQENNNDKSSTFGDKNEDRFMTENEKHKIDENTFEKMENGYEHAQTKAGSDKEMGESSLGKMDGNKELRLGVGSELEANRATGDDCHTGNDSGSINGSEDSDGIGNSVCGTVGENTDTCGEETGKIQGSKCELSNCDPKNDYNELRCDRKVDEGLGHNKEQEQNESSKIKEVVHNGSEHPDDENSHGHGTLKYVVTSIANNNDGVMERSGMRESEEVNAVDKDTEKFIKAGEESEEEINRNRTEDSEGSICNVAAVEQGNRAEDTEGICNDEVMERSRSEDSEGCKGNVNVEIERSRREDSEGGSGNVKEVMESRVTGDLEDMNAVSEDADEPTEDAGKNEAATKNELVVERNRTENSDKDSVNNSSNKSAEKAEEIDEENQNSAEMLTEDAKEIGAEVTQDRNKKDIVDITRKNEVMHLEMKKGEEMDVEVREENVMDTGSSKEEMKDAELAEKNEMDLEYSERQEKDVEISKEKAKSVEMTEKERQKCVESKENDTEMTGEKRDVETAEEIMMDIERTEGNEEKDEVEGKKIVEMSDAEEVVDEKGKKRVDIPDAEMVDERVEGTGKKLEEDKCGDHEVKEKGQEYKQADSSIMAESQDNTISDDEKEREEKKGELADKVCTSEESEGIHGTDSEVTMAERSPRQDEREKRNVSEKRSRYDAEEVLSTGDKHETYKKQNDGVKDLAYPSAVKASQKQTVEANAEQQEKEAEKAVAKITSGEELQNKICEGQTIYRNADELVLLNASEDPHTQTGKDQPAADKKLSKRAERYHVPNLDKTLPNQSEQDQPKVKELEKRRQSTEESTLHKKVEKSNSMPSNEKRGGLHQHGEVQGNISVREANREMDHQESQKISLGNMSYHKAAKRSSSGKEVTDMGGHYKKSHPQEVNNREMTSSYKPEQSRQRIGDAVCATSKRLSIKNSFAKKSTTKMKNKTLNSLKDQSIDNTEERRQNQKREKRGVITAQPHMQKSSPVQPSSVKEVPRSSVAEQRHKSSGLVPEVVHPVMLGTEYVYTDLPNRYITPVALSTLNSQPWKHVKIKADSDDSDIEIIAESIISPRNVMTSPRNVIVSPMTVSVPVIATPMVCEVCQIIWNDDVLEAIFEGNKAVTVNSKITFGAILCFSRYAEAHYFQNREHILRNVLERAELGKNIGNLNMTEVIKWLRDMMRHGAAKCCDVFDAVYNPENARAVIASMMKTVPKEAPALVSREQNIQKRVENTPKRKISNSSGVKYLTEISSATAKLTTSQDLSPKVSKSKDIGKTAKSTHTLSKIKESLPKSGDVVKEVKATLEKSNIHVPKTALKSFSSYTNKDPVNIKTTLKKCSVYLGKRVHVPQHQEYLQPVSSSPATPKRRRSLEEVEKEVPCKKRGKDSGLLSDKEYDDTEVLSKLGNKQEASQQTVSRKSAVVTYPPNTSKKEHCWEKKQPHTKNAKVPGLPLSARESADTQGSFKCEAEQTISKKSTRVLSKHSFNEDEDHVPAKENEELDCDTPKDKDCSDTLLLQRNTTSVSKQLSDEKITANLKQKLRESDKVRRKRDAARVQEDFKEKIMPQDHIDSKNLSKRNRTPSKNKKKTEETNIIEVEDRKKVRNASLPLLVSNHLSEQKKRPCVDPVPQSVKRQKVMHEAPSDPLEEDMSEGLPETSRRLSSTIRRKARGKTKRLTSTDSRDSESSSHDSLLDEPPQSYDSSDESDCRLHGTQLASPIERTRTSEKTQKSQKTKRTKSQRATVVVVKKSALSNESSSDSHDNQITYVGDLTSHSERSLDRKGELSFNRTEVSTNTLLQQLRLNVSGINLYCSVTNTKTVTNGDMVNNSFERRQSTPALEAVLKERTNLDGVARDAFDLLPFEPNNFSSSGYNGSKERYLTNQELLVLQNICVLNPENPDVDMFYKILTQILLARKRVLLVPNSFSLLLVAEGIRKEFNRAKRKGNYAAYLSQDWDVADVYTAEDFWLGNNTPPNMPSVCTVLSLFCLWKNLEKRVPISFPIALEELCRNLVLKDMDKIGSCVKLYSRYCAFLYEDENPALAKFFLNQPFLGIQTELQKENLLCRMPENSKQAPTAPGKSPSIENSEQAPTAPEKSPSTENSKQASPAPEKSPSTENSKQASAAPGKSSSTTSVKTLSTHTFHVTENDVQMLLKKCMEVEQAVLQSSGRRDKECFWKCVQALKYKIAAYKKEIHLIQNLIKETKKKKLHFLSKLINPEFKDCTKELSKHVETLYTMLSKRITKLEMIKEVENMSVKKTNGTCKPPLVLQCADLGEHITESMKELVYELLINQVNIEDVRPVLCAIVQNFGEENLPAVPSKSWIRNFARLGGLKVKTQ